VSRDLDVLEAVIHELLARPLRKLAVARSSSHVRLIGEKEVSLPNALGVGARQELLFDRQVLRGTRRGESERRCRRALERDDGQRNHEAHKCSRNAHR
jgi:hypothetical protein